MKYVRRMHGLESAQSLVDELLAVVIRRLLCANDAVHVCFHKLLDEVNFRKAIIVAWLLNVEDGDDVFMVEVPQ